jgi:hypothetical protein
VTSEGPVSLPPTETQPGTLKLWSDGQPQTEYYLLENRQPTGWDRHLPGGGMLVWHVDDVLVNWGLPTNSVEQYPLFGVRLMEADGLDHLYLGINRGDAGDPYPGSNRATVLDDQSRPAALSNYNTDPHVSIRGIRVGSDLTVQAYLSFTPDRWLATRSVPGPSGSIGLTAGPGTSMAADPGGSLHFSWADDSQGGFHIFYMRKDLGLRWQSPPMRLDDGDVAFSPALAADAQGNVLAVWSQLALGRPQVVARHRSADGVWGTPHVLRDAAAVLGTPALLCSAPGQFACAWSEKIGTAPERVQMQFYTEPQGWQAAPTTVHEDSAATSPALAVTTQGSVFLAYLRRAQGVYGLYWSSGTPGGTWSTPAGPLVSGRTVRQPLLAPLDSGRVMVAWREPYGSVDGIFYRRYTPGHVWEARQGPTATLSGTNWPYSVLSNAAGTGLTFLWENAPGTEPQVEYREILMNGPWDTASHLLAGPDSGGASQPVLARGTSGNTVVSWLQAGMLHTRTRQGASPVGSPPAIVPLAPLSNLGQSHPNPMRPNAAIPFRVPATGSGDPARAGAGVPAPSGAPCRVRLTILDVSGRRVRQLLDEPRTPGQYEVSWDGTLDTGRRAPSGIYFYRLDLGGGGVETRKLLLVR